MKTALTEKQLREAIAELDKLLREGDGTAEDAIRLDGYRAELRTIQNAKNRRSLW